MKKNDWIVIVIVSLTAVVFYLVFGIFSETGTEVIVTADGALYGTYDLNENQTIQINDTNTLEIRDGKAFMVEAECPDGLCLHQAAISKENQSIICLPNKVVVTVESDEKAEYDVMVQ